ncbi:MAG: helix-turn-helix domain-containing protein [Pseudomonadota bacterium]
MGHLDSVIAPMTQDETVFFKALGARIAALRIDSNLTQQQLADALTVSQQVVASYEVGRRRVPVSLLPALARVLGVSIEELIGEEARPAKRGPAPKLQRQIERIQELPKPKQRFVMEMLDTVLQQQTR